MATSFPGKDPGYEVDKMAASGPLRNYFAGLKVTKRNKATVLY
jgi:hypothetical protein